MNSVYSGFEDATSPGKLSPSEKKKLLYVELNKYKELKEQIEATRSPENEPPRMPETLPGRGSGQKAAAKETRHMTSVGESAPSGMLSQARFDEVVDALKTLLLKELSAIREDIARLAKSK